MGMNKYTLLTYVILIDIVYGRCRIYIFIHINRSIMSKIYKNIQVISIHVTYLTYLILNTNQYRIWYMQDIQIYTYLHVKYVQNIHM